MNHSLEMFKKIYAYLHVVGTRAEYYTSNVGHGTKY